MISSSDVPDGELARSSAAKIFAVDERTFMLALEECETELIYCSVFAGSRLHVSDLDFFYCSNFHYCNLNIYTRIILAPNEHVNGEDIAVPLSFLWKLKSLVLPQIRCCRSVLTYFGLYSRNSCR